MDFARWCATFSWVKPGHVVNWSLWMALLSVVSAGLKQQSCKQFTNEEMSRIMVMLVPMGGLGFFCVDDGCTVVLTTLLLSRGWFWALL